LKVKAQDAEEFTAINFNDFQDSPSAPLYSHNLSGMNIELIE
jgi:hypothetical protein